MTDLRTMQGRLDRCEGLRLLRMPEIGEQMDFIDRTARPDAGDATDARTRTGTISEIHPGGVTLDYEINGYKLHAFLCWADVAFWQRRKGAG